MNLNNNNFFSNNFEYVLIKIMRIFKDKIIKKINILKAW